MRSLSQLLRWRDLDAESQVEAVRDAILGRLIVAPTGGPLHVALVRISVAASRTTAVSNDGALVRALVLAWADCPCEKHRQALLGHVGWSASAQAAARTPLEAAKSAVAAVRARRWRERSGMDAAAIVARWLPSPPIVTIDGVEYDLDDETTRAVIALSQASAGVA